MPGYKRTERHAEIAAAIGAKVRKHRIKRGYTIEQLAVYSGMTYTTLSEIERGRSVPTIEYLERLAELLNVRLRDLLPDEKPKDNPPAQVGNRCFQHSSSDQHLLTEGLDNPAGNRQSEGVSNTIRRVA